MALPSPRDAQAARAALTSWLSSRLDGGDVALSELSGPPATGFSNETILFDATWIDASGGRRREGFAVRVRPSSHSVFPVDRFEDQYRVMSALAAHTDVLVPPMRWYEDDPSVLGAPFMVMGRVEGEAPSDNPPYAKEGWLADSPPAAQEQVWWEGLGVMAAVHLVDWRQLGLDGLEGSATPAGGAAADRLAWWEGYLAWAAAGESQPVPEAAVAWLRHNRPAAGTGSAPPALCWGDARLGNQLFTGGRVRAVLDWEMVHVGDPVWDLAWFLWMDRHHSEGSGATRLPGFPSTAATVARWEEVTGRTAVDLEWWTVLAGLGFAAVMVRLSHLLIALELFPAGSDFARSNTGVTFLASELDRIGAR